MDNNSIKLTAPEISGLWSTYIQNSAVVCILKHFLSYLQDSEIKPIVEESLRICQSQSEQIKKIYAEEQLPIFRRGCGFVSTAALFRFVRVKFCLSSESS